MSVLVEKRDSKIVDFKSAAITNALLKAFKATKELQNPVPASLKITKAVEDKIKASNVDVIKIADIQKLVEFELAKAYPKTALAYVEYRLERDIARDKQTSFFKDIVGLRSESDLDIINENANKDAKLFSTKRDLLAGLVSKEFAKKYILPKHIVRAHEKGLIHYHDLDYSPFMKGMFNCMLVDIPGMLKEGFCMGGADIEPPKSILSAAAITAQIICQVSNHIYGGVTVHSIDTALAPYVKMSYEKHLKKAKKWGVKEPEAYADELTKKECYDAFQTIEYSINCINTCQGQTPFTTLGLSGFDTSKEARLITWAVLQVRLDGLGKDKKTAIFPKLVYTIRKGYNFAPDEPNYDLKRLALKCASKRIYPDILNYDKLVDVTKGYKTPMGCRSFLGLFHDENGREVYEGRNNLGVITINLPRIALETKNEEEFFALLDERLALCKEALLTRIDSFKGVKASVSPILYMEGACGVRLKADDEIMQLFDKNRASISLGYIGLSECVNGVLGGGKSIYEDERKKRLSLKIMARLRAAADAWKEEYGFGFSLYGTPAESLCYRFLKLDQKDFGVRSGVTDKEYYTNSFHLDVRTQTDPFSKLDFEKDYPAYASGGFINYVETPNLANNLDALEQIWDYSYDKVPYYGTNQPIDACFKCGFEGEFKADEHGFACPDCNNQDPKSISVTRRVCGYLGAPEVRSFNAGKQAEVMARTKHA